MPILSTDDSVRLHYEETGSGTPIVFVHEFAGDSRSWEPQVRYLSRRYRCIAYNARGYPPSEVPADPAAYSQDRARDDVLAVLDGLAIERAHVVGLVDGRLRDTALRPRLPPSRPVADARRRRLRRRSRAAHPVPAGGGRHRRVPAYPRHGGIRRVLFGRTHPGAVPEQGPKGLARVRRTAGGAFPRPDRPTPSRESRRNVLRSSISPIE